MPAQAFSPKVLLDLYRGISKEKQVEFLKLLGGISDSTVPFTIYESLTRPEMDGFIRGVYQRLIPLIFPLVLKEARQVAKSELNLSDEEFDNKVHSKLNQLHSKMFEVASLQEREKLKAARDRKSDPAIVKRNLEMCELRKKDPKKYTQEMLARKYKRTARAVRKVLENEQRWRRLDAQ